MPARAPSDPFSPAPGACQPCRSRQPLALPCSSSCSHRLSSPPPHTLWNRPITAPAGPPGPVRHRPVHLMAGSCTAGSPSHTDPAPARPPTDPAQQPRPSPRRPTPKNPSHSEKEIIFIIQIIHIMTIILIIHIMCIIRIISVIRIMLIIHIILIIL